MPGAARGSARVAVPRVRSPCCGSTSVKHPAPRSPARVARATGAARSLSRAHPLDLRIPFAWGAATRAGTPPPGGEWGEGPGVWVSKYTPTSDNFPPNAPPPKTRRTREPQSETGAERLLPRPPSPPGAAARRAPKQPPTRTPRSPPSCQARDTERAMSPDLAAGPLLSPAAAWIALLWCTRMTQKLGHCRVWLPLLLFALAFCVPAPRPPRSHPDTVYKCLRASRTTARRGRERDHRGWHVPDEARCSSGGRCYARRTITLTDRKAS